MSSLSTRHSPPPVPTRIDLGPTAYFPALEVQRTHQSEVLAARDSGRPDPGRVLFVEHYPPVITITKRAGARMHLLASAAELQSAGVDVADTDRGGDVTYHGPGQIVTYPILDLNLYHLRLHEYMRLLESAVIDTLDSFGMHAMTEAGATGVWVNRRDGVPAKICAMGVRVRRWVSMHGLALNVTTDLAHFGLIVPCGLARPVTSVEAILAERGQACPPLETVRIRLFQALCDRLRQRALA